MGGGGGVYNVGGHFRIRDPLVVMSGPCVCQSLLMELELDY